MWDSYTLWNLIWYMQLIGLRIMALLYFIPNLNWSPLSQIWSYYAMPEVFLI